MSRMKCLFAVLVVAVIAGAVPQAFAGSPDVRVALSGSSAMWETMALGAYNKGTSLVAGGGATKHWTTTGKTFSLTDTRPTAVNNDSAQIWIVWDSCATTACNPVGPGPNVWVYANVDSVVGDRCYFAQPHCNINASAATLAAAGQNAIPAKFYGNNSSDATSLPASIQTLFVNTGAGVFVTGAATDIRPEDAQFAICRVNSDLGNGSPGSGDGLDGLGYDNPSGTASGTCQTSGVTTAGNPIKSGYPGSTATANPLAFLISGSDPFSGTAIPGYTTVSVGAAPIVFVVNHTNGVLTLNDATEKELQKVFSGTNCDAGAFATAGLSAGAINIFLREPLSGTMNTTEATVFRRPTVPASAGVLGISQEDNVGTNNPLAANSGTCLAGSGHRYRGIGTGEVVKGVLNSNSAFGANNADGIAYAFFSYGNVASIAGNANYGYTALNGIDPIFQSYGTSFDPGQPATSSGVAELPLNTPCGTGSAAFPCKESLIWKAGFSFPNLRNGLYRSWSILRIVTDSASGNPHLGPIKTLISKSQAYVVSTVPDYVPAVAVTGTTDLGLKLVRSHYQQKDGNGANLGPAPVNSGTTEAGGDMGGQILPTLVGVTTAQQLQLIQDGTSVSLGPVHR